MDEMFVMWIILAVITIMLALLAIVVRAERVIIEKRLNNAELDIYKIDKLSDVVASNYKLQSKMIASVDDKLTGQNNVQDVELRAISCELEQIQKDLQTCKEMIKALDIKKSDSRSKGTKDIKISFDKHNDTKEQVAS